MALPCKAMFSRSLIGSRRSRSLVEAFSCFQGVVRLPPVLHMHLILGVDYMRCLSLVLCSRPASPGLASAQQLYSICLPQAK